MKIAKLEITTKIGCSNNCNYCPQQKLIHAYSKISDEILMSFDTFKECISKLPKETRINFTGFGEPFLNNKAINMIEYADEKGYLIAVSTTLKGLLSSYVKRLEKIDFDLFAVHLPSINDTNMVKSKTYIDRLKLIVDSSIKNKKYHFHGETLHEDAKIVSSVQKARVIERAGNLDNMPVNEKNKPVTCKRKFSHPVLLPNGDLAVCCMDYSLENIIGNLKEQEPDDIYKGNAFVSFINQTKQKQGSLCHKCSNYGK